jgi:hypothetical protein
MALLAEQRAREDTDERYARPRMTGRPMLGSCTPEHPHSARSRVQTRDLEP